MSVITTSARNALAAVKGYRKAKGVTPAQLRNTHRDDQANEIADLIADLCHLADQQGFDVKTLHARGLNNHEAERDNARRGKLEGYYGTDLDAYINS